MGAVISFSRKGGGMSSETKVVVDAVRRAEWRRLYSQDAVIMALLDRLDEVDVTPTVPGKPDWFPTHIHYKGGYYRHIEDFIFPSIIALMGEVFDNAVVTDAIHRGEAAVRYEAKNGGIFIRPAHLFYGTTDAGEVRFWELPSGLGVRLTRTPSWR